MGAIITTRSFDRIWLPGAAGVAALVVVVELLLLIGGLSPPALLAGYSGFDGAERARFWLFTAGTLLLVGGLPVWLRLRAGALDRHRKRHRARLESFEAHFRAVGEAVPQGIFLCDVAGAVTESNSSFRVLQGVGGGRLPPDALVANVHPEDHEAVRERWLAAVAAGEIFRSEHRVRARRGDIAVRVYAAPVGGPDGIRGFAGTVEDLSELKGMQRELVHAKERAQAELVQQLTWQATHDVLTGLENRRGFTAAVEAGIERGTPQCLLFLDLDGFKEVNDACGHGAGDDLLRQVAALITANVRASDALGRLGGDEFAALLDNCTTECGRAVAEKIRAALDALRFARDDRVFQVSASIGLVPVRGSMVDVDHYLALADAACYAAKSAGRNRVIERAADGLERQAADASRLAERIRGALRLEGFTLHAQPIRRGAEDSGAPEFRLVPRLYGDDGQWIASDAWLPVAARNGSARAIRRWIIGRAASLLAERGPTQAVRFTVHLSASSVEDEALVAFIASQIAAEGIEPALLAFEIDLRSVLASPAKAAEMAAAIRTLGCRVIVCGFDGHSGTLAMMRTLPADAVKLAPSLVRDAAADLGHRAIAEAIHELAITFGREVIAEGVDTRALHQAMRDLGIAAFQGEAVGSTIPLAQALWPHKETLVDQPVPDRVVRDLGVGAQVELFQQPRPVHADCLRA